MTRAKKAVTTGLPTLTGKTVKQKELITALKNQRVVMAVGSAGTGKTYCIAYEAARRLLTGEIDKIVLSRPNIEAGEKIGLLPGTLEEKFDVWVLPFLTPLKEFLTPTSYSRLLTSGAIECIPLGFLRGRSFSRTMLILDEAQNATWEQLQMFVTRAGEGTTLAINGDVKQCDLKAGGGLEKLRHTITTSKAISKYSRVIEFTVDDVVRSDICGDFIRAFDAEK